MTTATAELDLIQATGLFEVRPYMGGEDGAEIRIGARTPESREAISQAKLSASQSIADLIRTAYEQFLESGDGQPIADSRQRIEAIEEEKQTTAAKVSTLIGQWHAAVRTGTTDEIKRLESQVDQNQKHLDKLAARLTVLTGDHKRLHAAVAPKLRPALDAVRDEAIAGAKQNLDAKLAALQFAVNSVFLDWFTALAEHAWCTGFSIDGFIRDNPVPE